MSKKKKFEASINGIEPYRPDKNDFDLGFKNISTGNMYPPAYVVAYLFLNILKLTNFGEMEKVWWHTYFKYKDTIFMARDYKFGSWSLEVRSDSVESSPIICEVMGKIKAAGRQAGKMLEDELSLHIQRGEFWINNSYYSLRASFDFFLEETNNALNALCGFQTATEGKQLDIERPTSRFNERIHLERILTYRIMPLITSFFSLLEFLLDAFFVFEQPGKTFFEFRQLNWQDRMKSVVRLELGSKILKCYEQIVRIKSDFRNPLTHGLTNESALLVPVQFGGLVPVSYEHLSNTLHYGMTQISPKAVRQIVAAFNDFLEIVENVEPYMFYIRYLAGGFSLPVSKQEIDRIRKEMSDIESFDEYLEACSQYEVAVTNRDI